MSEAVGLLEVYGLAAAFAAGDAACKAANVTIEAFDRNKPANADKLPVPLIILVKIRGSVSDVEAGLAAGERAAMEVSGVVAKHVIASPEQDTERILEIDVLK
ncbi:MAG: BMC domain-containing protein [Defluviitaleaceae bacterium]|nr:BMC domain-containing protein [Defluviitaleaceae bacterium]